MCGVAHRTCRWADEIELTPTHALLYCTGFVRRARFEEQITTLHDSATTFFKGNERECVLDLLEMASCIPSPR